jgi:hypothetical protein
MATEHWKHQKVGRIRRSRGVKRVETSSAGPCHTETSSSAGTIQPEEHSMLGDVKKELTVASRLIIFEKRILS